MLIGGGAIVLKTKRTMYLINAYDVASLFSKWFGRLSPTCSTDFEKT